MTKNYPSRIRHAPDYYHMEDHACVSIDFCCLSITDYDIPKTYKEAIESSESPQWKLAMDTEMQSLIENETFTEIYKPSIKNIKEIGGRWVYTIKEGSNDVIFKARYVAEGFSQVHGQNYFETFSPTPKMSTLRILMQIVAQNDLLLHQMDVKSAYLHAEIDCDVYIELPEGYKKKDIIWKLEKSLYGLKQSGRNWNQVIHKFFTEQKLIQSKVDPCLYMCINDENVMIILIWVDDIIIAASYDDELIKLKEILKKQFKMKDLGYISNFLGIHFTQTENTVSLDQSSYLNRVLHKFDMIECKPRNTPCEKDINAFYNNPNKPKAKQKSSKLFREIVGSLIYAMLCTRPDISWIITKLSQHLDDPNNVDWLLINHVMRYIKGSLETKLCFTKSDKLQLVGYCDADWGGDPGERKSTSGYYFCLNNRGPPISWKSRKQPTVAVPSCEAEYMAAALCIQEALYLSMLLN